MNERQQAINNECGQPVTGYSSGAIRPKTECCEPTIDYRRGYEQYKVENEKLVHQIKCLERVIVNLNIMLYE